MALTASMALASFAMLTHFSYMEIRISSLEAVLIARGQADVQIHELSRHSDTAGQLATQLISDGGLRCSSNMGSCRRSCDARTSPLPKVLLGPWLVHSGPVVESRRIAQVNVWLFYMTLLSLWVTQVMRNGGLLCSWNMGSCRRRSGPVRRGRRCATTFSSFSSAEAMRNTAYIWATWARSHPGRVPVVVTAPS